jgi:hypothetical protein
MQSPCSSHNHDRFPSLVIVAAGSRMWARSRVSWRAWRRVLAAVVGARLMPPIAGGCLCSLAYPLFSPSSSPSDTVIAENRLLQVRSSPVDLHLVVHLQVTTQRALTKREQRFLHFASIEHDNVIYMTPMDFIDSMTLDAPRGDQHRDERNRCRTRGSTSAGRPASEDDARSHPVTATRHANPVPALGPKRSAHLLRVPLPVVSVDE